MSKKGFYPVVPIPCYGVYQAVAEVDLVVFNVWTWDIEDYFIILIPKYVRILLGSQPTPGAVSWILADMCQRLELSVLSSVSRQRMVTMPLLQVVASSCNDDMGNSGYACGTGTCSRPS